MNISRTSKPPVTVCPTWVDKNWEVDRFSSQWNPVYTVQARDKTEPTWEFGIVFFCKLRKHSDASPLAFPLGFLDFFKWTFLKIIFPVCSVYC